MSEATGWPSRSELENRWLAIIDGSTTREDVHDWTVPWVEGEGPELPLPDAMIEGTLQRLHGFTMAYDPATPHLIHHGPPGIYVRSMDDIQADYRRWKQNCADYDADPVAHLANLRQVAETHLASERLRLAQPRSGSETQN